jgi:hypothetical protein
VKGCARAIGEDAGELRVGDVDGKANELREVERSVVLGKGRGTKRGEEDAWMRMTIEIRCVGVGGWCPLCLDTWRATDMGDASAGSLKEKRAFVFLF